MFPECNQKPTSKGSRNNGARSNGRLRRYGGGGTGLRRHACATNGSATSRQHRRILIKNLHEMAAQKLTLSNTVVITTRFCRLEIYPILASYDHSLGVYSTVLVLRLWMKFPLPIPRGCYRPLAWQSSRSNCQSTSLSGRAADWIE